MNIHKHTRSVGELLAEAVDVEARRVTRPVYAMHQDRTARMITGIDLAEYLSRIDTTTDLGRLLYERLEHAADRALTDHHDNGEVMLTSEDTAKIWDWTVTALLEIATRTTEGTPS